MRPSFFPDKKKKKSPHPKVFYTLHLDRIFAELSFLELKRTYGAYVQKINQIYNNIMYNSSK